MKIVISIVTLTYHPRECFVLEIVCRDENQLNDIRKNRVSLRIMITIIYTCEGVR